MYSQRSNKHSFEVILELVTGPDPEEVAALGAEWSHLDPAQFGVTWVVMPDGDSRPRVAMLTPPDDTSRFFTSASADAVGFHLYTRKNRHSSQRLVPGDKKRLSHSPFDPEKETKFIVHGWMSSLNSTTVQNLKDAYLKAGDVNVVAVDWGSLASSTLYLGPKWNTWQVSESVADLVRFLEDTAGGKRARMHVVGHSLGAHVAGQTGHRLAKDGGRIARVTGLDPAMPGFLWVESEDGRLDASDADFVDVVHTCGGVLGYSSRLGHADFFPNGGTPFQPGCGGLVEIAQACSHARAHEFFAESITAPGDAFLAVPCDSWDSYKERKCRGQPVPMGERVPRTASGMFFLETNGTAPFALGPRSWFKRAKKKSKKKTSSKPAAN
ncbi:pancreatic triacylglycerol lipase-like [Schistocerca serialis cubense]|uniref:pancreatic triacylglycerol lipase-like n=1 Tax=Schistocerca serialis cubense TaxID=2023355 RepID=UPI00214F1476|nr:pancreatic triacylglycerol lipase-like [Schistocerca serialis cubense]